jgi:lysyl-tRNA synthetase class 2
MANTSLASKSTLQDRGLMLARARSFFAERGVLEVDCPILSRAAPIDLHIDVMQVDVTEKETGYLHTSPEYGMKRLLAAGTGDIYQLCHVFRQGEIGRLHNPEFTMVEWYRLALSFEELIDETAAFIHLFLTDIPVSIQTYRQALLQHAQIDYLTTDSPTLATHLKAHGVHLAPDAPSWDKDTLLNLLFNALVEPKLGQGELSVIRNYPASQSALSKTEVIDGENVALRFEIYGQGIELANGYFELTDPIEQRRRLESANRERMERGKASLPLDENLISALESGIPTCCGVAVGFDRLMLLRHSASALSEVLPFAWPSA